MINAKEELLEAFDDYYPWQRPIELLEAVKIVFRNKEYVFTEPEDFTVLLNVLDYTYDNLYGPWCLKGFILLNNGEWFERTWINGFEAWRRPTRPTL